MATKTQIKKILKDIEGLEIKGKGEAWEIGVVGVSEKITYNSNGFTSLETTAYLESLNEQVIKTLEKANISWGGYMAGWGGMIMRPDYKVNDQDYCDPSNPIHY